MIYDKGIDDILGVWLYSNDECTVKWDIRFDDV
jgi:hypothetical protein